MLRAAAVSSAPCTLSRMCKAGSGHVCPGTNRWRGNNVGQRTVGRQNVLRLSRPRKCYRPGGLLAPDVAAAIVRRSGKSLDYGHRVAQSIANVGSRGSPCSRQTRPFRRIGGKYVAHGRPAENAEVVTRAVPCIDVPGICKERPAQSIARAEEAGKRRVGRLDVVAVGEDRKYVEVNLRVHVGLFGVGKQLDVKTRTRAARAGIKSGRVGVAPPVAPGGKQPMADS